LYLCCFQCSTCSAGDFLLSSKIAR
jgi:hypothetical protein